MDYALHILTYCAITIPVSLGYNLVFGRGKIMHFGQGAISLVAVYAIFIVQARTGSFALGIMAGLCAGLLVSQLFAWLALRLEADALGIFTIAAHLAVLAVVLNWDSLTRGALGISGIRRISALASPEVFFLVTAVIAVLWTYVIHRIDRSSLGRALTALSENQSHAMALGVHRRATYMKAFAVAGMGSVLSSVFFPQFIGLLHPNDYQFDAQIFLIMVCLAGNPGSVFGVAVSTSLLVVLKEGLRFVALPYGLIGPIRLLLFGLILFASLYRRRTTIFPEPRTV